MTITEAHERAENFVADAWRDCEKSAPFWMCPYCGKAVGIAGRLLAAIVGVGIHQCDFSRVDETLWSREHQRAARPRVTP